MALVWADRILETTTTLGTAPFALDGALLGYQAFADACSVSDTVYYAAFAVDDDAIPTGPFESGIGTYTGTSELTRSTVLASSNGGDLVSFSADTKWVMLTPAAAMQPSEFMITVLAAASASAARTALELGTAATSATSAFDAAGTASAAVAAHVVAADPHPAYALESALGSLASLNTINGGNWSGADLAVTDGGTGASTASVARTNLSAAALSQTAEMIGGFIASPSDKSYKIAVKMAHGGTITEATTVSVSGTCTATFKVNTTALGGTANSVSSSEQSQTHSSANTFVAGDDIVLTVSANASCADLSFSLKYTRTLE